MRKVILWVLLLGVIAGAGGWYLLGNDRRAASFREVHVERGDLLATINSTGTIEPEEVVDVGAQVAGQIIAFGYNPSRSGKLVDFGTPVEKDTVLARIDESLYRTLVDRARATVEQGQAGLESALAQVSVAEANVQRAEADLLQMKAKVYQADRDYERAKRLAPTRVLSELDVDTAEATARTSRSGLAVGEATIVQMKATLKDTQANVNKAKATLHDAEAALQNAEINLGYCTIKSPVKGVIVDRRVNIGQTVVSSLNAPSLFLIAKDLKRMQVWASVNEADVGNIFSGQTVSFTVDAYPDRVFKGVVAPDQPRLNASMTQNVVTYTVVVDTDNSDGKLLPYLTANMRFEVDRHSNVLLVPNAVLRYKPNPQVVAPEARDDYIREQRRGKTAPGEKPAPDKSKEKHDGSSVLWVEDGGFVRPVKVRLGLSDGLMTEILSGDLEEGMEVVVGESRSNGYTGTKNPFAPKMFGGGTKQ